MASTSVHDEKIAFFRKDKVDTAVESFQYVSYLPTSGGLESGYINWCIKPLGYVDLPATELEYEVQVVQASGTALPACSKTNYVEAGDGNVINDLFDGLIWKIECELSQQSLNNDIPASMHPYKANLTRLLFSNGEDSVGSMYFKAPSNSIRSVSQNKVNTAKFPDNSVSNPSMIKRFDFFKESQVRKLRSKLKIDFFNTPHYLLPNCDLRLKLYLNSPEFVLTTQGSGTFKIKVTNPRLIFKEVVLSPMVTMAINKTLKTKPARYPYANTSIKTFNLNSGILQKTINNIYPTHEVPSLLVLAFVDQSAVAGSLGLNPFDYQNVGLRRANLFLNHSAQPFSEGLEFDFNTDYKKSEYSQAYSVLSQINPHTSISHSDFNRGYTLVAFPLCDPNKFQDTELTPLSRKGQLKLELQFASGLDKQYTLIIYGLFHRTLLLDEARTVKFE